MGIPRGDVHNLQPLSRHMVVDYFFRSYFPELDQGFAADHQELLALRMVPVVALGDAALGDVHRELAALFSADDLGEAAAVVGVHPQRIAEPVLGQVAQVGAVQHLLEAVRHIGYGKARAAFPETLQKLHDPSQLHRMDRRDLAVFSHLQDITLECGKESLDHVIDVHQVHDRLRVVHRDGKVPGDVVAEGGDSTVVVGPAPLAEDVGKAEHMNRCTRLLGIAEKQVLPCLLALPIGIIQSSLDGGCYQHRAGVVVLPQRGKQGVGEAEVALHELIHILGPVHSGKMEDKFAVLGESIKEIWIGIDIVEIQVLISLASQFTDEVPTYKAIGSGYQYPHPSGSPRPSARPGCTAGRTASP